MFKAEVKREVSLAMRYVTYRICAIQNPGADIYLSSARSSDVYKYLEHTAIMRKIQGLPTTVSLPPLHGVDIIVPAKDDITNNQPEVKPSKG